MEFLKNIRRFSVVCFGFGLIGNSLIIAFFLSINRGKFRTMTTYHFLLTTMAIFDTLVCLSHTILGCIKWNAVGIYTQMEELVDIYITSTSALISIWTLVLISFTRCQRIVSPFTRQWSKKVCFKIILIICCLSSLYHYSLAKIPESKYAYLYYNSCTLAVEGIIPQILMFHFYKKTCRHIKNDTMQMRSSKTKRKNASKTLKGLVLLNLMAVLILKTILYIMSIIRRIEKLGADDKIIINSCFFFINYTFYYSTNILNVAIYAKIMPKFQRFILGLIKMNTSLV